MGLYCYSGMLLLWASLYEDMALYFANMNVNATSIASHNNPWLNHAKNNLPKILVKTIPFKTALLEHCALALLEAFTSKS